MRRRLVGACAVILIAALAAASPASAWNVKSANGDVSISHVRINGHSSWVKTDGGPVNVTFDYAVHDPCMLCFDQLEVGWAGYGPNQCVYDGQPLGMTATGTASFSLPQPQNRGVYYLTVDQGGDYSCGQTLPIPGSTWWNGNPPDPDTRLVGMNLQHSGFMFHYGGTIYAELKISGVHIDGHPNQATVKPGSTVSVALTYTLRGGGEIDVGLANKSAPLDCLYPASGYGHWTYSFTAPTKRGSYFLAFDRAANPSGCPSPLTSWWTNPLPLAQPHSGVYAGDTQFMGHLTVN